MRAALLAMDFPALGGFHAAGVADDGRERHLRGDFFQRVEIALDERRAFQEIEREIAADAKFGEDGKIRAALFGFRRKCEDA